MARIGVKEMKVYLVIGVFNCGIRIIEIFSQEAKAQLFASKYLSEHKDIIDVYVNAWQVVDD